ncbi:hypothetical protein Scep_013657 [Stephania cephalantha]|uniref:CRM domain-containing protein n=1 Tax=Stephania cephalantha TaxID=152367 RepID=A0AAP0P289_9MAGN
MSSSSLPSCQICQSCFLDSFQLSRARGFHFRIFFRYKYASSNSSKYHNFSQYHPQNKKNNGGGAHSWIHKWSQEYQPNFPKRPLPVLDYRNSGGGITSEDDDDHHHVIITNSKNGGGGTSTSTSTSTSTMEKIVEKLKKFGYVDEQESDEKKESIIVPGRGSGSVEDIFYVEQGLLPNSRGGFSKNSPLGMESSVIDADGVVRFPWENPIKAGVEAQSQSQSLFSQKSRTSLAELTLPHPELKRLRLLAIRTKQKMKIKGSGVTQAIVDLIHDKWKTSEIVRLKCEGPPALNMKRMHEILERKTGGLVIWRSGTSVSLYRGIGYKLPSMRQEKKQTQKSNAYSYLTSSDERLKHHMGHNSAHDEKMAKEDSSADLEELEKSPEVPYEHEIDTLLDGLGPRYADWPGDDPLPVDADLLPSTIPGYKPPFRVLPYGVRSNLGLKESTALRRLARVLPPHFAVGRSRQHHGLAMAMIKLWEKSSIAKIALKRGVQLTTSERMAEDIKKMTGGTLLSRNKDFIVFYRGKDFLSSDVTEALLERERLAKALQDEEEQARLRASSFVVPVVNTNEEFGTAGTLGETLEADARWGKRLDDNHEVEVTKAVKVARHEQLVRKLERKIHIAERKVMKAERALAKVEGFLKPLEHQNDSGIITEEERFMFRKLGLRMKAFLLLGRRGVFDGTVENMHLHWKYRELVKVIVKAKTFEQVRNVALSLEAESGGILVSVDKVSKGFAIIVYRGKNYKRPPALRPKNLLTKRKALARSIELQRREALCNHISTLQKSIDSLRSELEQMEAVKDKGDEKLYARLDSAYSTEDEDTEDESDDAYLMTYDSGNKDEGDNSIDTSNGENEGEWRDCPENYDSEKEGDIHTF